MAGRRPHLCCCLSRTPGPLVSVRRDELHAPLLQGRLNFLQSSCGASYLSGTFDTAYRNHVHGLALGHIRLAYVQQTPGLKLCAPGRSFNCRKWRLDSATSLSVHTSYTYY